MENIKLDSILYNVSEIEKSEYNNTTNSDYSIMYNIVSEEITNDVYAHNNCKNVPLQGQNKIFPYEVQNLEERFNMSKFPNRIRPEARVLKKYNTLANYTIVIVFLLFNINSSTSKKRKLTYYAELAHELIDAPVNSLKAKISQLDRLNYMGTNKQISHGLINAYNKIAHLDPHLLWSIIKKHQVLDSVAEINKLIKKDK